MRLAAARSAIRSGGVMGSRCDAVLHIRLGRTALRHTERAFPGVDLFRTLRDGRAQAQSRHPERPRTLGGSTMTVKEATRKPEVVKKPQVATMNTVHDLPVLVARD